MGEYIYTFYWWGAGVLIESKAKTAQLQAARELFLQFPRRWSLRNVLIATLDSFLWLSHQSITNREICGCHQSLPGLHWMNRIVLGPYKIYSTANIFKWQNFLYFKNIFLFKCFLKTWQAAVSFRLNLDVFYLVAQGVGSLESRNQQNPLKVPREKLFSWLVITWVRSSHVLFFQPCLCPKFLFP